MDSIVAPIPIDLDKRRHLRFDNRALLRAEHALCELWNRKINLLQLLFAGDTITLNDIAILLWQALRHEDPTLTLEETQDLMALDKIGAITEAVFAAWNRHTAAAPGSARAQEGTDGPLASTGEVSGATAGLSLA